MANNNTNLNNADLQSISNDIDSLYKKVSSLNESYLDQISIIKQLKNVSGFLQKKQDVYTKQIQSVKNYSKEVEELTKLQKELNNISSSPAVGQAEYDRIQKEITSQENKLKALEDEYLEKYNKNINKETVDGLEKSKGALESLSKVYTVVYTVLYKVFSDMLRVFDKYDSLVESISEKIGMGRRESERMIPIFQSVLDKTGNIGASLTEVAEVSQMIADKTGLSLTMQFEDLNKNILLFNKAYNVSSENSLKFVSALSEISNESLASQENMFLIAKAAQEAYGIPLPRLMRDLGNISENVRATFHGSSEELIEQAAQLIKINSSLNDAASSAKNLLNFQTSFQSELKASALLGQRLNLNEARRLFFQGKLAEGQEELLNQLRSIGGLEDKNYFQRQAIADAMGMSLEQLQKMETSDKNLLEIQSKFPELYKEQLDAQKELDELLGSDEDRRKRELEDLAKKDVFITKSKIAAELTKRIFQNLGKLTEPLVSGLYDGYIVILEWTEAFTRLSFKVDDFTENLKTLGKAFLTIAVPIVSIYGIYRLLSKPSSPSSGGFFKGLGGKLKGVGGFFKSMFSIPLTSILKFSAALVALSVGIGSLGYALQQFKTVPDPEKLGKILALVGAYGAVIAGLGTLLTGPQGLVALAVAVAIPASIALLGGALYTLAEAFVRFKDANLSEIGPNLVSIAKGIGMLYLGSGFGTILLVPVIWGLSKSISSIGKTAEKYAGNISSLGTGFKDLTTSLLNLADNKERIKSVFDLLESIDDIGDFNGNLTLDISEDTKKSILELNTSNENLKELINTLKQNNDELKQMFEQLIDNMNVNFNVDGTSVIAALATAKYKRGSASTIGIGLN